MVDKEGDYLVFRNDFLRLIADVVGLIFLFPNRNLIILPLVILQQTYLTVKYYNLLIYF